MQLEPRNTTLRDAVAVRRLHDVRLDHQIVVEEVGRIGVVGEDAADLRRGEEDRVGPRLPQTQRLGFRLARQVDVVAVDSQNFAILAREPPHQVRSPPCRDGRPPRPACRRG